jgi:hypothetical protein
MPRDKRIIFLGLSLKTIDNCHDTTRPQKFGCLWASSELNPALTVEIVFCSDLRRSRPKCMVLLATEVSHALVLLTGFDKLESFYVLCSPNFFTQSVYGQKTLMYFTFFLLTLINFQRIELCLKTGLSWYLQLHYLGEMESQNRSHEFRQVERTCGHYRRTWHAPKLVSIIQTFFSLQTPENGRLPLKIKKLPAAHSSKKNRANILVCNYGLPIDWWRHFSSINVLIKRSATRYRLKLVDR